MKNKPHVKLKRWSIIGVFVIFALAGLWHFLYDWLPCGVTAILAPVNESPWEHAKLVFAPAVIYFLVGRLTVGKKYPNFTFAHTAVLPFMPIIMLALFYFFKSLGIESLALDIVITFVVIALGVYAAYRMTVSTMHMDTPVYRMAALLTVFGMLFIFIAFTFYPPHIPLFQDSNTMQYGIPVK